MNGFKTWLEDLDAKAERVFGQRDKNSKMKHSKILQALGIDYDQPLKVFNKGSLATVYYHPTDPTKLIKVTADLNDAKNLVRAQRFNSSNIVKVHQNAKLAAQAVALVVDRVQGDSMPYNTNALLALINGDNFDDARTAARNIYRPDRTRDGVLNQLGLNSPEEKSKLARLFQALGRLEAAGIDIYDFTDNVIDAGKDYVMIDLGM